MDGTTGIFGLLAAESAGVLAPDLLAAVVAAVFFAPLLPDFLGGPAAVATEIPTAMEITRAVVE